MNQFFDLGPFRVERTIASGGAGVVWYGVHRPTNHPVAVKVVVVDKDSSDRIAWCFRTEAEAASALDHPSIVPIYEYGQVSTAAAAASGGKLAAGTPYLISAYVGGGTLRPMLGALTWPHLLWVIEALLEALAHAHARGVIHRDIKPENVLVTANRRDIRVTDFGIAYAIAEDRKAGGERLVAGTPAYIAPEQLLGTWRDHGPWTDLYSLGCLIWALSCGNTPHGSMALEELRVSFPSAVGRDFRPRQEVPDGFEEWLCGLLAMDPALRFRCAAAAAAALDRLQGASPTYPHEEPGGLTSAPATALEVDDFVTIAASVEASATGTDGASSERTALACSCFETLALEPSGTESPFASSPPPKKAILAQPRIPPHWRKVERIDRPTVLPATGVGLFGLRTVPLMARNAERDRLWEALRHCTSGRTGLVVLHGPTGFGKSSLLRWLSERAHEVGVTGTLWAGHQEVPGHDHGLGPMILRHLRCEGLSSRELAYRIPRLAAIHGVPPDCLGELLQLFAREQRGIASGSSHSESTSDRLPLIHQCVRAIARERPVLLVLDDVQWGTEALRLAASLLRADDGPAILVALAARDEALSEEKEAEALLRALQELPDCLMTASIGPLAETDHAELVRRLVGLDDQTVSLIATRTAGNPLFATHLVGDWIARGLLQPAEDGYRLASGASVPLPMDLRSMWSERLDRVLSARPLSDGVALEIAAVLGRRVDMREWRAACANREIFVPRQLIADLVRQRLVDPGPAGLGTGFDFVQEMLRETLELRAKEAGRLRSHHEACSRVFRHDEGPVGAERFGRHLFHAGMMEAALDPLLKALEHAATIGDGPRARPLLAMAERASEQLLLRPPNLDLARINIAAARIAPLTGEREGAHAHASRAVEMAREADPAGVDPNWLRIAAQGEVALGSLLLTRCVSTALEHLRRAARLAETLADPDLEARVLLSLARSSHNRQEPAAREYAKSSLATFESIGNSRGAAAVQLLLGWIEHTAGRPERARDYAHQALEKLRALPTTGRQAECHLLLGDIARTGGDPTAAQEHYEHACRLYRASGHVDSAVAGLNLAVVRIERGEFAIAKAEIDSCRLALERCGYDQLKPAVNVCLLPCLAAESNEESFLAQLEETEKMLRQTGRYQVDLASLAALAGDLAQRRGWTESARSARRLSAHIWRSVGREQEATAIEERL